MDNQDSYQLPFSAENGKNYETLRGQLKTPDNIAKLNLAICSSETVLKQTKSSTKRHNCYHNSSLGTPHFTIDGSLLQLTYRPLNR